MNIALWVAQGLLALMFAMAGAMKMTQPIDKLAKRMTWVHDVSPSTVRLIALLEVLGAIGLVAPMLTGIMPILTPLAAIGLILTMIGAALTNLRHKEYAHISINIVLMALAAFVAYGRFVGA